MRIRVIGLLLLAMATLAALVILVNADMDIRYSSHGETEIFRSPDTKEKLGTLGLNTEVSLEAVEGEWAHVAVLGWVRRDCLSDRPAKEASVGDSAGREFYYSNVGFNSFTDEITKCVGEMSNRSGKNFGTVWFKLSVYDAKGILLQTSDFYIEDFISGEVRSFDTLIGVEPRRISKYRIQFEKTY